MEWHPGNALADALGDERRDLGLGAVLRSSHPNKPAILDAAISGVGGIDFDEHRLLQLGQPLVRSGFLAAPFVLDQSAGREDERKLLGDTPLDSCLLYRETHVGQPKLFGVGQGRIFGHQLDSRRVDRLPVHWNWVRQVKGVHACLGVAVGDTAVNQCNALNAAGQVSRP